MSNPRDRVTVDLRGLGPAVKAEAAARNLTLAAFSRAAIVESLRHRADEWSSASGVSGNDGKSVKLTLRVPLAQASWLVEHARGAGLSCGTFLASVIDGAPCPGSLAGAVELLTASSDQMAALSRDLNSFMRLLRQGNAVEVEKYRQRVMSLFDEVREHMRLTAGLAAEVRRAVRFKTAASVAIDEGERHEHGTKC
jgi:hypothetical protein